MGVNNVEHAIGLGIELNVITYPSENTIIIHNGNSTKKRRNHSRN